MSDHAYTIDLATKRDCAALADMIGLIFALEKDFACDREKQLAGLEMLIGSPSAYVFVLRQGGLPVGMCSAQLIVSTAEGGLKALIEDVVILPGHRGQGLGHQLFAHITAWAADQKVKRLDLVADLSNAAAIAFYQKIGWKQTNLIAWQKKL